MPTYDLLEEKLKGEVPENTFIIPFLFSDFIEDCVDSIWENCDPKQHRIIVIDNRCTTDSAGKSTEGLYERLCGKVHVYLRSYRNLGCAKAWNIGVAMSDTKYVTILGDDTRIIDPLWWEKTKKYLKDHEGVTAGQADEKTVKEAPEFMTRNKYTDEEWHKIHQ